MEIVNSIRECFASIIDGRIREIDKLPKEYPAYVVKFDKSFGVCVPFDYQNYFVDEFSNVKVSTNDFLIEGKLVRVLYLSSTLYSLREEFALIAANFVNPGDNGVQRKTLLLNPEIWCSSWRDLLGNAKKDKLVFDVLGELSVLSYLYKIDKTVKWTGSDNGTHDIEGANNSYEVKSTIKKYESTITISNQNQLNSSKPLNLFFCRFEKNPHGISIDDKVNELVLIGYPLNKLEEGLNSVGLEKGKQKRKEKYTFLEKRIYEINKNFPLLSISDINNPILKDRLVKIVYTIDLTGLPYKIF